MKNSDAAMYQAKATGRHNFQLYTQKLNSHIMERMKIENELRRAVGKNEFVLFYQPQIELATGRVTSMEALIRWLSPTIGWILPDSFIYIAEEIGIINIIGEWVLRSACTQLALWHAEGFDELKISVNMSARQLQQTDIVELIAGIIIETGIKSEWLELEITESAVMKDIEHTVSILQTFKDMGIGISLDDFGKGYSSLNYLKLLPINNLKIDKTFVHDITHNSNQAKILKVLISLAHDMNLTVTAEGVENDSQLEFLKAENCDTVQGFLFSRPKSAYDLEMTSYEAYL
jgi:EAL domain-containing protein (putative c-di-GMP-specific phosphodiesterase class I)